VSFFRPLRRLEIFLLRGWRQSTTAFIEAAGQSA
jgi:hypothetical protein